jgi:hypothetical protein
MRSYKTVLLALIALCLSFYAIDCLAMSAPGMTQTSGSLPSVPHNQGQPQNQNHPPIIASVWSPFIQQSAEKTASRHTIASGSVQEATHQTFASRPFNLFFNADIHPPLVLSPLRI